MKKLLFLLAVVIGLTALSCSKEDITGPDVPELPNDIILEWNETAYEAFGGTAYQHSLMAARINAMTQLAMHDAVNAVYPVYATYAFTGKDAEADAIAAAASAAHTVLVHEIPDKKPFLDSVLAQSLAPIATGDAKTRGITLGKAAGEAILAARANDGSAGNPVSPVEPSETPGVYQAVPPFDFIFAPNWIALKPFGLQRNDQFRSAPHPALDSEAYTAAFNEVKEIGRVNSTTRTADQNAYANFWYEFSEAGWNRVARTVAISKKLDLLETARLLALVDMALSDAYSAGWDSKFHYNFWRPYTAIRRAAGDGNDQTAPDAQWEPAMPTPPVQDYPSTHSALGNAAATVLAKVLGDNTAFTMASPTALPGQPERSFTSFSQAADENADSRVMAGIHFRFACEAGQTLGDKIGAWVVEQQLRPLTED